MDSKLADYRASGTGAKGNKMSATNFRIENIQKATVNGRAVKIFTAFKKQGEAFVHVGQFSAPQKTANKNLWSIANEG